MRTREKELKDFLYEMYVNFGQYSVLNFIKDRQENGQLLHINWENCAGCETYSAFEDKTCLVCGGRL